MSTTCVKRFFLKLSLSKNHKIFHPKGDFRMLYVRSLNGNVFSFWLTCSDEYNIVRFTTRCFYLWINGNLCESVPARKKGKSFPVVPFSVRNFQPSELTACWLASILEVQSMAERSHPWASVFWWNLRWPRAALVNRCGMSRALARESVRKRDGTRDE